MGNDRGTSDTMRVLVADQEPEMLEAIARAFEVDVATSKATCIDLLRANTFDVIVACERLNDGSGLELLSHVGQRWPNVIRILAIEPERRAMLKGRLGPFKLFETLSYPIEEDKLEAALTRAAEALARAEAQADDEGESEAEEEPARSPSPSRSAPGAASPARSTATTPKDDARRPGARTDPPSPAPTSRNAPPPGRLSTSPSPSKPGATASGAKRAIQTGTQKPPAKAGGAPGYPPLPAKGSKIVPLGSTVATDFRILPHAYDQHAVPGRQRIQRETPKKEPTLQEKAAALAAEALSAVVRYMKPQTPTRTAPRAAPRKKR